MEEIFRVQQECLKSGSWDSLREYYKPDHIKFILVGEAPPEGGDRYFYYDNVPQYDNLFMGVIQALFPNDARVYKYHRDSSHKRELLQRFKDMGGYLMEVYPMPKKQKARGCGDNFYIQDCIRRIVELRDNLDENFIIIAVHSTASGLNKYFQSYPEKFKSLDFPLYGNQDAFVEGLREIVNDICIV